MKMNAKTYYRSPSVGVLSPPTEYGIPRNIPHLPIYIKRGEGKRHENLANSEKSPDFALLKSVTRHSF